VWGEPEAEPSAELVGYLRSLLFGNPWRDEELPSVAYEEDGRVKGLIGVLPRRMLLTGRPLRVAVAHSFMVDPRSRDRLAGIRLLRRFLDGEQDLSLTDAANDVSRRLWTGLGGAEVPLASMGWVLPLRPFGHLAREAVRRRRRLRPLAIALSPLTWALDAVAARAPPARILRGASGLVGEIPSVEALAESVRDRSAGFALRPDYDAASLRWLLDMAARKRLHGPLRVRLVKDAAGGLLGHHLYCARRGAVAQVLQIAASVETFHRVLAHLSRDAWQSGALALAGRIDAAFAAKLGEARCLLTGATGVLVHSRDPAPAAAILRGDAFLTRLEGEWWLAVLELVKGGPYDGSA
jgi:hypothetical protein